MNHPRSKIVAAVAAFLAAAIAAHAQTLYTPGGSVGTSSNSNVGIGMSSPAQKLDVAGAIRSSGEVQSTSANAFRMVNGNYGTFLRNDGNNSYILLTNSGNQYGSWNSLRPVTIGNSTGNVSLGNNALYVQHAGNVGIGVTNPWAKLVVSGANSGDSILAIEADLDNNNENDNPRIEMRMDGGLTGLMFGFAEEAGGTANVVRLATMYGGTITWDTLTINPQNRNVGIGTTNPTQKLAVNGAIRAKEVIVDTGWSDFVFEDDYRLPSLDEVEEHIRNHRHLPGVPSAAEVQEDGLPVGETQKVMMQKIEELTLYLLQMKQANEELHARVHELEMRLPGESTINP